MDAYGPLSASPVSALPPTILANAQVTSSLPVTLSAVLATYLATLLDDELKQLVSAIEVEVLSPVLADTFTKALLHFNGTHGSTTFTDSSRSARVWTANGSAKISTVEYKLGGASGAFDGASGASYLETPDTGDFTLGTSDFTIDLWFNCTAANGQFRHIIGQRTDDFATSTSAFNIERTDSGVISAQVMVGGSLLGVTGTTVYDSGTNTGWHHLAFVRTGNTVKLFLDGVQEGGNGSVSGSVNDVAVPVRVGRSGGGPGFDWQGYLDEVRLSIGIARWTSNFVPPGKLYAATRPFISRAGDVPANTQFEGTLEATLRVDRALQSTESGYGGYALSISELSLINAEGLYDELVGNVSLNGQKVTVTLGRVVENGITVEPYANFERVAQLHAQRFKVDRDRLTIELQDPALRLLTQTAQAEIYGGTGDLDGHAALAGKRRPLVRGSAFNVTPTLVIPNELLYQVNVGRCTNIITVKDGGAALTFFADYDTVGDLRAASASTPPGYFSTCNAEGYFQLGGSPEKQVTADVQGPNADAATIIQNVAARVSGGSAFDVRKSAAGIRLTNGARTAAVTGTAIDFTDPVFSVWSFDSKTTGKYCMRFVVDINDVIGGSGVGFGTATAPWGGRSDIWIGDARGKSVGLYEDGQIWFNDAGTGDYGTSWGSGSQLLVAVDIDARKLWFKVGPWSDGNDSFTKALLHMNGTPGTNTFYDSNAGGSAHTWTAAGDAKTDSNSVFGQSAIFDGTGDWLSTPDHANFTLGSSDFTVDFWFKANYAGGGFLAVAGQANNFTNAGSAWQVIVLPANTLRFSVFQGSSEIATDTVLAFTSATNPGWHHFAAVRSGTSIKLYIDGVQNQSGATTVSGSINDSAGSLAVGRRGDDVSMGPYNGRIDEFRLSVGIARWTANFTPPVAPYSADWNGSPTANPATGVGGFDMRFPGSNVYAGVTIYRGTQMTVDFYPSKDLLPVGYSQWGTTPFFGFDTASFTINMADQPAANNYFLDQESSETCAEMFSKLMAGIGGFWGMSQTGDLYVQRFQTPDTVAAASYDTKGGRLIDIDRVALPDGVDPPPKRRRVIYQRNWTVMTDLFGIVTETTPAVADQLRAPYSVSATSDAEANAILANYPAAPDPDPVQSYFTLAADAAAEAERLMTLYSQGLTAYRMTVTHAIFLHRPGDTIQVTDSRLGLASGKLLRLVAVNDDLSQMTTELIGFG